MNSKEALERIANCDLSLGYDDYYEPPQHCGYVCVGTCYQDEYEIIKRDLEILEILKKKIRIDKCYAYEMLEINLTSVEEDFKKVKEWLKSE